MFFCCTFLNQEEKNNEVPYAPLKNKSHNNFLCPITQQLMKDPVVTSDGYTFERNEIQTWLDKGNDTNPVTGQKLENKNLIPNRALKDVIDEYRATLTQEVTAAPSTNEEIRRNISEFALYGS